MVENNSPYHININIFILKLFAVMYIKLWFSSVLPGKSFNKKVNYAMVDSFYIVPSSSFITSLIFDDVRLI
jgi:hypothetical protein